MEIRKIVGRNLLHAREARGLTQASVAEMCGFETPSYNRWENGKAWPNPETIQRLADFYDVPVTYFYRDDEARKVKPTLKEALDIVKEEMGLSLELAPGYKITKNS